MTCTPRRLWLGHAFGLAVGIAAALALLFVLSPVLGLVLTRESTLRDGPSWVMLGLGMQLLAILVGLVAHRGVLARHTGVQLDRAGRRAALILTFGGAGAVDALVYKGFVTPIEAITCLVATWLAVGGWLLVRSHCATRH